MSFRSIVIDTNVIISGLRSRRGASFKLLQLVGRGHFDIHLSVPLILEYEDVLLRYLSDLMFDQNEVEEFLDYLSSVGQHHEIFYLWRPTLKDPNDEMVLELAVKSQSDFIVTFNVRDFKGSESFGVECISPAEFLKMIGN